MLTQFELQSLLALLGDVGKSLELVSGGIFKLASWDEKEAAKDGARTRFHIANTLAILLEERMLEDAARVVALYAIYGLFRLPNGPALPVSPDHPYLWLLRSFIDEDSRDIESKGGSLLGGLETYVMARYCEQAGEVLLDLIPSISLDLVAKADRTRSSLFL